MNFSDDIFQQIEDYLNGTMNAEETKAFENQMDGNPELADAIKINKQMRLQYGDDNWHFINDDPSNNEVNELEALLKSNEFQIKKKAIQEAQSSYFDSELKTINKPKLYSFIAVAASVMLLIGLFFFNRSENLYENYNSWSELPSLIERGEEQNSVLQEAEKLFLNKDYNKANQLYNQYLTDTKTTNSNVYLYLGITQLELNKKEEALSTFDKIITSNSIDFSKGYWYKALTYLKVEDKENAIKELEIIISNSENYKFSEAKTLLEKLKN